MKKMKKLSALLLAFVMLFALAACGGGAGSGGGAAAKTTPVSGDMVTGELPAGWILVTGTDMNGADRVDYICHTENYTVGDPYLQAEEDARNIEDAQALLESGSPFGTYAGEKELANGTWYLAENAAVTQLGDKVMIVRGYQCDFGSEEVQGILGSLQWV